MSFFLVGLLWLQRASGEEFCTAGICWDSDGDEIFPKWTNVPC